MRPPCQRSSTLGSVGHVKSGPALTQGLVHAHVIRMRTHTIHLTCTWHAYALGDIEERTGGLSGLPRLAKQRKVLFNYIERVC